MGVLWQDLRYSTRMLLKSPGFTLVAVITLALGIGANAAIFSLIYSVLLRPLPFKNSDRLVVISETNARANVRRESTSVPNVVDWQARTKSFEALVASAAFIRTVAGEGDPEQVMTGAVGPGFFTFLGVQPVLGRAFSNEDYRADRDRVALLSFSLWKRRFGADPSVAGRKIQLNGELYTVIGVLPSSYRHPEWRGLPKEPEIWFPFALNPDPKQRRGDFLAVMARLRPGVSVQQARNEMATLSEQLAGEYPAANGAWRAD
jgi:putative ABC transport system permease protein